MEYSGKRVFENAARKALTELSVDAPDSGLYEAILKNWDGIAKPLDGLGRFETLTARIGAISGTDRIDISKKAVIIMCADNGIVAEGISQSGQEVTAAVARQMAKGASSVGKMAALIGADTIPVDIGMIEQFQNRAGHDRGRGCQGNPDRNRFGVGVQTERIPHSGNRRDGDRKYDDKQRRCGGFA